MDGKAARIGAEQRPRAATQRERMRTGLPFDPTDPVILADRARAGRLLARFNNATAPEDAQEALEELLGTLGERAQVIPPFTCDFGYNIHIGEDSFVNLDLLVLDGAPVRIGKRCMIGPRTSIYTAVHPLDADARATGTSQALAVRIEDDVWLGGNVVVNPGVTIGARTVIGSGSVVTHDIPSGVLAAGNPCRVIRPIETA